MKQIVKIALVSLMVVGLSAADKETKKPVVAFAGVNFEDVPQVHQNGLLLRFHALFAEHPGIVYKGPNPVIEAAGKAVVDSVLETGEKGVMARLAQKTGADYVFYAQLRNRSEDADRIMLVGDVVRYDVKPDQIYRTEVLKYLEDIGVEMVKVRLNLVETIAPEDPAASIRSAAVAIGSIMAIGLLMLFIIKTDVRLGGDGNGGGDNPGDPGIS